MDDAVHDIMTSHRAATLQAISQVLNVYEANSRISTGTIAILSLGFRTFETIHPSLKSLVRWFICWKHGITLSQLVQSIDVMLKHHLCDATRIESSRTATRGHWLKFLLDETKDAFTEMSIVHVQELGQEAIWRMLLSSTIDLVEFLMRIEDNPCGFGCECNDGSTVFSSMNGCSTTPSSICLFAPFILKSMDLIQERAPAIHLTDAEIGRVSIRLNTTGPFQVQEAHSVEARREVLGAFHLLYRNTIGTSMFLLGFGPWTMS